MKSVKLIKCNQGIQIFQTKFLTTHKKNITKTIFTPTIQSFFIYFHLFASYHNNKL
jgi:hypothetical protein